MPTTGERLGRSDLGSQPAARHGDSPLRRFVVRLELRLVDAGHVSLGFEVDARQRDHAVNVAELDARVCAKRRRRCPVALRPFASAIVKQPERAAALPFLAVMLSPSVLEM